MGSRFLQQKPGHHHHPVAATKVITAARAGLSKFAGVIAHHAPTITRAVVKAAAHVHVPHLHLHVPHLPQPLIDLSSRIWRMVHKQPAPPPEPAAEPLKKRFNKPSGPKM